MRMKLFVVCCLWLVVSEWVAAAPMKLTLNKTDQDRRYVLAEKIVPTERLSGIPFFKLTDEAGKTVSVETEAASDGHIVRWLIKDIPANVTRTFTLDNTDSITPEEAM